MAPAPRQCVRLFVAGTAMAVAAGGGGCGQESVSNATVPGGPGLAAVAPMSVARAVHTATLLADGRVLITGGFAGGEVAHASAELFDPGAGRFFPAARMHAARVDHTATLLEDGRVLVAGGFEGGTLSSAELYDPRADRFEPTGSLTTARGGHKAVRLQDGRVLVVGGDAGDDDSGVTSLASVEIYDPRTGKFTPAGTMAVPRSSHTATLLGSGHVLVTGGHQGRQQTIQIYASAELFDPSTGRFRPTGSMTRIRHKHDAVPLSDGRVLVVGGADARDDQGAYSSVEAYDPAAGGFAPVGEMTSQRYKNQGTSVRLLTGQVLLAGGAAQAEVYDPANTTFARVPGDYGDSLLFAASTSLLDGRVLITGGYGRRNTGRPNAWIYAP